VRGARCEVENEVGRGEGGEVRGGVGGGCLLVHVGCGERLRCAGVRCGGDSTDLQQEGAL
jgi:hypothetical protein